MSLSIVANRGDEKLNGAFISFHIDFYFVKMTSKTIDLSDAKVPVKAMNLSPVHAENQTKEQCDKTDEKHKDCHAIRCRHMQPMQSATTALSPNPIENNLHQKDSKQ